MFPPCIRNGLLILAGLLLPAAGLAAVDSTKPSLISIAFAPGSVDVSATAQSIGVTLEAADSGPGIQDVYCNFISPSGKQNLGVYLGPEQLVSGTPLDGIYSTSQQIGVCAESGTWTLSSVEVQDQCGNTTLYAATAGRTTLAYPGKPPDTLVVANSNAPQPLPGVTAFAFTPSKIAIGTTNTTVTVTVTGSNIGSGDFTFVSHSGDNTAGASFTSADENPPGTFTTSFTMGICTETGTWSLQSISVSSADDSSDLSCGGMVTYNSSNFPASITAKTFTVTNPNYDTTNPSLLAITLDSRTVDVSNGSVMANVYVRADDDTTGVSYGSGIYSNTAGEMLMLDFTNPEPGVIFSGNFHGTINVGACATPGVYSLKSFSLDSVCGGQTVYGPGKKAFPAGVLPSQFTVVNGAGTEGSLGVNITPAGAENDGASWYVDGDSSQIHNSGAVVSGLTPGQHRVDFTGVIEDLYSPPAELLVNVVAGQTNYTAATYLPDFPTDAVQVSLIPAIIGAQWCVDSGPLQPSGATVAGLTDGSHTISFTDVNGFIAPASQVVTTGGGQTTLTSGTYSQLPGIGSLTVNLLPQGAVNEGCTWSIDGGAQQSSGTTLTGLPAAPHTLSFTAPNGSDYSTPQSETVYVIAGGSTSTAGTFTAVSGSGSLLVTLSPAALNPWTRWYLTGGALQKSGTILRGLPEGPYTVNFTPLGGFYTPPAQAINIEPDQTISVSGTYLKAPPFVGTAQRFAGLSESGTAFFALTMDAEGRFTGKLVTASAGIYVVSGSLNTTGSFQGTSLGAQPISYSLHVTGTSAHSYIATFTSGNNSITAYPAAYASDAPGFDGKDTMLLYGTDSSIGTPQGIGYANVTYAAGGVGTAAGRLGDGTPFSCSSVLVQNSGTVEMIIFDPLIYNGKGLLSGMTSYSAPPHTDFSGLLQWKKPAGPGSYYPDGFTTTLNAAGDYYKVTKPVAFSTTLTFTGGVLPAPVVQPFSFALDGTVTVATTTFQQIAFSFNPVTGAIVGSFKPAIAGVTRPIPFAAQLLKVPKKPVAGGFFVGPVISGSGLAGGVTLP